MIQFSEKVAENDQIFLQKYRRRFDKKTVFRRNTGKSRREGILTGHVYQKQIFMIWLNLT